MTQIVPGSVSPMMAALRSSDPLDNLGLILKSLRFRSSATPSLSRTFSAGNTLKWTLNFWVKRGQLSSFQQLLNADQGGGNYEQFRTQPSDIIIYTDGASGGATGVNFAPVFRDPASFVNITLAYDSAQSTQANRVKFYLDSILQAQTSNTISLNRSSSINSAAMHAIGNFTGLLQFDGYFANYLFVDGQALNPAAFGQVHPTTGQWRPITKSAIRTNVSAGGGTRNGWGTNGFFLPFDDATSLATLGYDRSQSDTDTTGNNWTSTNISLTSGVTYDSMSDTPTNNFSTWNFVYPLDGAKSNANLTVTGVARATISASLLSCQWELTAESVGVFAGLVSNDGSASTVSVPSGSTYGFRFSFLGNLEYTTNGTTWTSISTGLSGDRYPYATGGQSTINFGQRALLYSLSSGYNMLSAKNLQKPIIQNLSNAFVAVTDTGSNVQTTVATARSGWTNYIEIFKRRDSSEGWRWRFSDDVSNYLDSSSTAAKAAFPSLSGTSYVSYALKVSASNGVATGVLNHTNGFSDFVSDGLSNARKVVILKNEASGVWYVYHPDLTAGKLLYLEQTSGESTDSTISSVTSSSFTVAAALATGNYRWISMSETAGFLNLGKYFGNSLTNGPFNNAGISPNFTVTKTTILGTSAWGVIDSVRDAYNPSGTALLLNSSAADVTGTDYLDSLSNGFKLRQFTYNANVSGTTQIYISIGNSFRYANAK